MLEFIKLSIQWWETMLSNHMMEFMKFTTLSKFILLPFLCTRIICKSGIAIIATLFRKKKKKLITLTVQTKYNLYSGPPTYVCMYNLAKGLVGIPRYRLLKKIVGTPTSKFQTKYNL